MTAEYEIPEMVCPVCREKYNRASLVTNEGRREPKPGDVSICLYCGSWLEFLPQGKMQALTPEKQAAFEAEVKAEMEEIKARWQAFKTEQEYVKQIVTMADRAAEWRKKNPDREAKVQFNFPRTIFMIQPISEALATNIVSANEAGLELIKNLWGWEDSKEPTVFMVRMALEAPTRAGPIILGDRPDAP